jgi:hypothetical protein
MCERLQRRVRAEVRPLSDGSVAQQISNATVNMQAVLDAHFGKAATAAMGVVKKRARNPWNAFYRDRCVILPMNVKLKMAKVRSFDVLPTNL